MTNETTKREAFEGRLLSWEREVHAMLDDTAAPEPLPPYVNGPAIYLLWHPENERQEPEGGVIIYAPVLNYDEVVLQVSWKMVDPSAKARFDLVQTLVEYPPKLDDPSIWTPLLDQYDREKSTVLHAPGMAAAENRMRLRYHDLHATYLGLRLVSLPCNARASARIDALLLGHSPRSDVEL